jgi:uncharacterized protein (TIGR02001 family)
MAESRRVVNLLGAAGVALFALTGGALADGYEGSIKDAPAAPAREFTYSFGITGTSDYVFRGYTQTDGDPTIQGTINVGYGIFYAGVWASGLDFGGGADGFGSDAEIEADWYAGIKPTWGKATFDFGVIYYTYPGASDSITELDYVELKAGVSGQIFDKLTGGATVYYSPEYTLETGETVVVEGTLAYALPQFGVFSPTVSGLVGYLDYQDSGLLDYTYWNAGVSLAIEKITLDFRYWDTDISSSESACATGGLFACDERFVFSASVALP